MSTLETNLVQPSSGTNLQLGASGDTVDIPSGATLDVTGATVSGLSAGKVLQYVYTEGYSGSISVDNNTTPASAGATFLVSITPTATDSKILIQFGSAYGGTQSGNYPGKAKLYRQIASGGYSSLNSESMIYLLQAGANLSPWGSSYTDSPSTTSQCDYQLYVYTGGNDVAYFTANDYFRFIRAWEIGA
tara:strand:- start:1114 stop:1680 length:567 start_codon:yes stop_codon:yes gene_type:complete